MTRCPEVNSESSEDEGQEAIWAHCWHPLTVCLSPHGNLLLPPQPIASLDTPFPWSQSHIEHNDSWFRNQRRWPLGVCRVCRELQSTRGHHLPSTSGHLQSLLFSPTLTLGPETLRNHIWTPFGNANSLWNISEKSPTDPAPGNPSPCVALWKPLRSHKRNTQGSPTLHFP